MSYVGSPHHEQHEWTRDDTGNGIPLRIRENMENTNRGNISTNPLLEELGIGLDPIIYNSPEKNGFPRFVKLKSDGEKVRVIAPVSGSGFFELLVLRRNGEMFQIGITECVAFDDYVNYMFNRQDALIEEYYAEGPTL